MSENASAAASDTGSKSTTGGSNKNMSKIGLVVVGILLFLIFLAFLIWLLVHNNDSDSSDSGSSSGDTPGTDPDVLQCQSFTPDTVVSGFTNLKYFGAIPSTSGSCDITDLSPDDIDSFAGVFKSNGVTASGPGPLAWSVNNNTSAIVNMYAQFYLISGKYVNLLIFEGLEAGKNIDWTDVDLLYGLTPNQSIFFRLESGDIIVSPFNGNYNTTADGGCLMTPNNDSGCIVYTIGFDPSTGNAVITTEGP